MSSLRLESRQYKAKGIAMITDKIEMTIPGELPDLNTIIAESKKGNRNWQPYNHMKKEHTEKIAWIAKSKRVKFEKVDGFNPCSYGSFVLTRLNIQTCIFQWFCIHFAF